MPAGRFALSMTRILTILMLLAAVVCAQPADAAKRSASKKKTHTTKTVTAREAAEAEEMTYASVSRTNPFEIVPAAGMELLEDLSDEAPEIVNDLIAYAKSYMGTRYVRGGKSPKGFDCSGFTSYVFNQFGTSLSASSAAQYNQGVKVKRDEVVPGDLLFFTGRNSRSGRVGHVAIAIDSNPVTGEITFIHAAISGGIRIDRTSQPYYAARYLGARRVL